MQISNDLGKCYRYLIVSLDANIMCNEFTVVEATPASSLSTFVRGILGTIKQSLLLF